MMGGYWKTGRSDLNACFNYTFRDLPPHNGFAITAGLEQLLDLVENLRFTDQDLDYLAGLGAFDERVPRLSRFLPSALQHRGGPGRAPWSSPTSPSCRWKGPLIEAQLLETVVLNTLNFQTLIATKAARIRLACGSDDSGGVRPAPGPGPRRRAERQPGGLHRRRRQHLQRAGRQALRHPGARARTPTPG